VQPGEGWPISERRCAVLHPKHVLIVIPARRLSRRLVDKPLRSLWHSTVIEHVVADVLASAGEAKVVLSTDSRKVAQAVEHVVEVCMTPGQYRNGTERVAATLDNYPEYQTERDIIVNVQGDQLFVSNEHIEGAVEQVQAGFDVGTMAAKLLPDMLTNSNRVKVLIDDRKCLDFFRLESQSKEMRLYHPSSVVAHHLGIYAYRPQTLAQWIAWPKGHRESLWGLEQLRPLDHGMTFGAGETKVMRPQSVDSLEDLDRLRGMSVGDVFKLAARA